MLESEAPGLSHVFTKGFTRDYDAHIYYDASQRVAAVKLRETAAQHFRRAQVYVGRLRDEKVGPHPLPMFELNFPRRCFDEVVSWLQMHRHGLTVLVHRVTGDDFKDHKVEAETTDSAIWLGTPLVLDVSKFSDRGVITARS